MPEKETELLLGIDVGTTTVSAQVLSAQDGKSVCVKSIAHGADLPDGSLPGAFAQDTKELVGKAESLVRSLLAEYEGIVSIGVTGQMHGVVFADAKGGILSPLYTWQNGFGNLKHGNRTICDEIERNCGRAVPTGWGVATYYALKAFGLLPENTEKILTAPDLLVSALCGKPVPSHPTMAASLGLYDLRKNDFDADAIGKICVPRSLLPEVQNGFAVAGWTVFYGRKIPVSVAIGDNQACAFGSLNEKNQVLLNVGTGSQVSLISDDIISGPFEVRPYFDNRFLLSGAPLCGGRAYAMLKDLFGTVLKDFCVDADDQRIYDYMNTCSLNSGATGMRADTRFCGTRSDPSLKGSFMNIGPGDLTPGGLSAAVLRGIAGELYEFYAQMPGGNTDRTAVGTGNGMRYNPALRAICEDVFGMKIFVPSNTEEASCGAALYGGIAAGAVAKEQVGRMIDYAGETDR
ncbi:MAG: hypothetical protein IKS34_04545 [Clostridia bacterium]|nr:hypothetical protein [Clostridia bacterium]